MDIVSRLKLFLTQNGIANSQFADTCDIPRPTLSQLLNGRNKKVSDEIITKIHNAYPALNILWLMFGDGDMFVPNANNSEPAKNEFQKQPSENSLFESVADDVTKKRMPQSQQSISFAEQDDYQSNSGSANRSKRDNDSGNAMVAAIQTMMKAGNGNSTRGANDVSGKRVVSIMVFYSDNSFETFMPA